MPELKPSFSIDVFPKWQLHRLRFHKPYQFTNLSSRNVIIIHTLLLLPINPTQTQKYLEKKKQKKFIFLSQYLPFCWVLCWMNVLSANLFLALAKGRPLDGEGGVLADQLLVVEVDVQRLAVRHHQVKVCHLPKLLQPDDRPLQVSDGDVETVAGDGLVVEVVLELESHRHFEAFFAFWSLPHRCFSPKDGFGCGESPYFIAVRMKLQKRIKGDKWENILFYFVLKLFVSINIFKD